MSRCLVALLFVLLFTDVASATRLSCPPAPTNPDRALISFMCQQQANFPKQANFPNIKMYIEYGGAGAGASMRNFEYTEDETTREFSASMTKVVTVFMMLELLAVNEGVGNNPTHGYARNNWTLDTKVRIVKPGYSVPAGTSSADYVYVGEGYASSSCNATGWAPLPWMAQLGIYDPANGSRNEYTIRQLIMIAMAASYNDAALLLGGLVASRLGIPNALTVPGDRAGPNSNAHVNWISAFRAKMNESARDLGGRNHNFCSPAGWDNTASAGCSNKATVEDWAAIAKGAYDRIEDTLSNTKYYQLFVPQNTSVVQTQINTCEVTTIAMRNSAKFLLAGTGSMDPENGAIRLVKTGTTSVRNLLALAEPRGDNCQGDQMVGVIMGLPDGVSNASRDAIMGGMFEAARQSGSSGQCQLAYNGAAVQAVGSTAMQTNMTARERQVAEEYYLSPDTDITDIIIDVQSPPEPSGDDGTGMGPPGGNISSEYSEEECDERFDLAEQWGEQVKTMFNLNTADGFFASRVDEIFSQQCIGKLITMMQQVVSTVDTIKNILSSADMMQAVIGAAAGAIVKAVMDQIFNSLSNAICNVTNAITGAIDNVSRNLLCFKSPLFSMPNDPWNIPIDIEDISCSGLAINPLYFSNAPGEPLARGSIGGVSLNGMRSDERPFYCGVGYIAQCANGGGTGGNQGCSGNNSSMGLSWSCVPDPNYQPADNRERRRWCRQGRMYGSIGENDSRCRVDGQQ